MHRHLTFLKKTTKAGKVTSWRERLHKRRAFIACMLFATVLGLASAFISNFLQYPALALTLLMTAFVFEILGIGLLVRNIVQEKNKSMHLWALEESEKQEVLLLRGNTEDELNRMLDYHLKVGNIQEADAISHRLLAIVDKEAEAAFGTGSTVPAKAVPGAPTVITANSDNKNGSLPDWMNNSEAEERKKSANLPEWLK